MLPAENARLSENAIEAPERHGADSALTTLGNLVAPKLGAAALGLFAFLQEANNQVYASDTSTTPVVSSLEGITLSDIAITGNSFTALLGSSEVQGVLDDFQNVAEFTYKERALELDRAFPLRDFSKIVEKFDAAIAVAPEGVRDFSTADGVNFEFTYEGKRGLVRGNVIGFLETEAVEPAVQTEAVEHIEEQIAALRNALEKQIREATPAETHQEFERRAFYSRIAERVKTAEEFIIAQRDFYEHIPYHREVWEDCLTRFREEVSTSFDSFNGAAGHSTQISALREIAKPLAGYEEPYDLEVDEPEEYSTEKLLMICERLERSEGVNVRHRTVLAELQSRRDGARSQEERQSWTEVEKEFSARWIEPINGWSKAHGWERWDPESLSQEDHLAVIEAVDGILAEYEEMLELEGVTRDSELAARCAKRMKDFATLGNNSGAGEESASQIYKTADGQVLLTQELDEEGAIVKREFSQGTSSFSQSFEEGVLRSEKVTSEAANEKNNHYYDENGLPTTTYSYSDGTLRAVLKMHTNGTILSQSTQSGTDFFTSEGVKLISLDYDLEARGFKDYVVFDATGTSLASYPIESQAGRYRSTQQYLQALARVLNTDENIHIFFDSCMRYTSDDASNKWQGASETLQRVSEGRMLGDCDDYAFLARDIKRLQGQHAHVLGIPGHALCIWVTRDSHNRYYARTHGTFGYDFNGVRFGEEGTAEAANGFGSIRDAVNSVLKKYRFPGLGLSEGQDYKVGDKITILKMQNNGGKIRAYWETAWITSPNL